MLSVKICGITSVEDARAAALAGADYLGLNFVPSSKRFIQPARASELIREARVSVIWVGVVADLTPPELEHIREVSRVNALQLHGSEKPEVLAGLPATDYQALRIGGEADVRAVDRFGGELMLVDAKSPTQELGGSGHTFDWKLVTALAGRRKIFLAGGLRPDNVAEAVRVVGPYGVDVASGVEHAPGRKDHEKIRQFVEAARAAASPAR